MFFLILSENLKRRINIFNKNEFEDMKRKHEILEKKEKSCKSKLYTYNTFCNSN